LENAAEFVVFSRIASLVLGDGLVVAGHVIGDAAIDEGLGVAGIDPDRLVIIVDRSREVVALQEGVAAGIEDIASSGAIATTRLKSWIARSYWLSS
jgi:hypothetical protein